MEPYRAMPSDLGPGGSGACPSCGGGVVWPAGAVTAVCACGARYATALAKPRMPIEPRIERFPAWVGDVAALGARWFGGALVVAGVMLSIVAVPIVVAVGVTRRGRFR